MRKAGMLGHEFHDTRPQSMQVFVSCPHDSIVHDKEKNNCYFLQICFKLKKKKKKTRFVDKQIVKLQETPDEIPEGGTPHTVSILMHDKLVDAGKPGDRVEVGNNV